MTPAAVTTTNETGRAVALAEQVKSGNVRAVSRLITLLENRHPDGAEGLRLLKADASPRNVIGVTGYPGAGKSTLISALVSAYRRQGMKVAVLAVDVSSTRTGGALLGDRIRMLEHAIDPGVYIRSMATRGHRGGLARTTDAARIVLEAAGYDVVVIETVGVGQNEADILNIAPTVVAVVAPGLGDDVQAMKAGLLELAHIIVVNKGDHPRADSTIRDLREWCPTVIGTVATTGAGLSELLAAIAAHQRTLGSTNVHQRVEQ
ncbi:MAG TPA: methylmalonyl Co-A mutase-associated GTPase MeaB [Nitrospira sp.]